MQTIEDKINEYSPLKGLKILRGVGGSTFAVPFSEPPTVILTPYNSSGNYPDMNIIGLLTVTTTGFSVSGNTHQSGSSSWNSTTPNYSWVAIGI